MELLTLAQQEALLMGVGSDEDMTYYPDDHKQIELKPIEKEVKEVQPLEVETPPKDDVDQLFDDLFG